MPPAGYTAAVLEGFTRRVLRYRNAVIVGWLLIAALGVGAGLGLNERLTALTATPGSPSAAADALLVDRFGENSDGLFTVFVHFTQATDEEILQLRSRVTAAAAVLPDSNVLEQRALGGVLFTTIGTSMDLLQASAFTDDLRAALRAEGVPNAMVTGPPALEHDVRPVLARDLQFGTLLALGVALALLLGIPCADEARDVCDDHCGEPEHQGDAGRHLLTPDPNSEGPRESRGPSTLVPAAQRS